MCVSQTLWFWGAYCVSERIKKYSEIYAIKNLRIWTSSQFLREFLNLFFSGSLKRHSLWTGRSGVLTPMVREFPCPSRATPKPFHSPVHWVPVSLLGCGLDHVCHLAPRLKSSGVTRVTLLSLQTVNLTKIYHVEEFLKYFCSVMPFVLPRQLH